VPTPARTSLEEILSAGRSILETKGLDGLTMQRVARAVGVRAPSLYKRVQSRGDLIRLIADSVTRELGDALDEAASSGDPRTDLRAIARAFRGLALANPEAYGLLFRRLPEDAEADEQLDARAVEALLRTTRALAGGQDALPAARTVVAWASGFVRMELAGAFRMGGDVDEAFAYGIDRLADALDGGPGTRLIPGV
jgi:AcrR family transcriptional regulator